MTLSRPVRPALFALLALLALAACRQEEETPEPAAQAEAPAAALSDAASETPATPADDAPESARYAWFMQGTTPAGHTEITVLGDGKVKSDSFIHWNNREWTVKSELQLDAEGLPVAQRITGISPFQAPIDETFELGEGAAKWSTVGGAGEATVDGKAFYLPAEIGALEVLEPLVRAALGNLNGELALLPSGTAKVEKVESLEVESGAGPRTVTLYAINGIGFTPRYAWFDDDLELVAVDQGGYLGMIPEGWDVGALHAMSRAQLAASARYVETLGSTLAHPQSTPVVFENVAVVDVENGQLLENRHVKVAGGVIETVSEQPIADETAKRIDAGGHYLMPGLWDMHGHFSLQDGVLNIAGGITSVRDIGSVHEQIMTTVAKYDSGEVIGPTTYRAGFMDKAGPYASGWAAETLEDALGRVDFFAENGYQQIKLYSSIEPGWVAPIAERAHGHGMRLSGHIPAFMSAAQAVEAGYDEIQHINMVFLNFIVGDQGDTRQQIRFTEYGDHAAEVDLDSDEVNDFIALLKENDVVVDATAAIFETMLVHAPGQPDPTFAAVIDHLPPAVARGLYNPEMVLGENWPASAKQQSAMLRKLHEAGVQIVPGSDNIAAFTVHRELEVYAEAGIPNADVLRIGTLDSARVVGVADKVGSIAEGKASDLVLLDANPLEDISAVRRAVLVMKGETLYRPEDLYRAVSVVPIVDSVALD